jgi:hypothetical protein
MIKAANESINGDCVQKPEDSLYRQIAHRAQASWCGEDSFSGWMSGAMVWENEHRVHLSLEINGDVLILSGIFAVPEDHGNGTHVLNAIKKYACENYCRIVVTEVDNPGYFLEQGFVEEEDWDEELTGNSYPDMWWSPTE